MGTCTVRRVSSSRSCVRASKGSTPPSAAPTAASVTTVNGDSYIKATEVDSSSHMAALTLTGGSDTLDSVIAAGSGTSFM